MAELTIEKILKRDGSVVPYDRARVTDAIHRAILSVGQQDRGRAEQLARKVEHALNASYGNDAIPSVEDIQDVVEATLMAGQHAHTARSYIIYRHERAKLRAMRNVSLEVTDNIPYRTIYDVLVWNMNHSCDSVAGLNRLVADGGFPDLVRHTDRRYEEELDGVVDVILARAHKVRLIVVAGPSSSGKTTTMLKIAERLGKRGYGLKTLNLDHYFLSLDRHPVDEFGDRDYETPQALDLTLINEHLERLLAGATIQTPHYDFKTGERRLDAHDMRLAPDQILLIDSLHGLYDAMTKSVPAESRFRLYVETLGQLRGPDGRLMRWADNRLLRRMIRDKHFRNLQPMETVAHWHYVRRSELQHIIPFISRVDAVVNTALPYELPILKHRLYSYLVPAIEAYRDEPRRLDAYIRARRLRDLLTPLTAVEDDVSVPAHSLLREFIGGSAYRY